MLWVRISIRARCTTLCDKVCQWLATGRWFSPCPPVPSTNKTDRHDITEILLRVALNTIKPTKPNQFTDSDYPYRIFKLFIYDFVFYTEVQLEKKSFTNGILLHYVNISWKINRLKMTSDNTGVSIDSNALRRKRSNCFTQQLTILFAAEELRSDAWLLIFESSLINICCCIIT